MDFLGLLTLTVWERSVCHSYMHAISTEAFAPNVHCNCIMTVNIQCSVLPLCRVAALAVAVTVQIMEFLSATMALIPTRTCTSLAMDMVSARGHLLFIGIV